MLVAIISWFANDSFAFSSRFLNIGVPAALVVLGCSYLPTFRFWGTQYLASIGDASYSIYLTHFFTLALLRIIVGFTDLSVAGATHYWALMILGLLVCSFVGNYSFVLFEQRISNLLKPQLQVRSNF